MPRDHNRSLERDLDDLLGTLCVEWGFRNRLSAAGLLMAANDLSADDFAIKVLEAEGMHAEHETVWRRRLRHAFMERYGSTSLS